MLLQFGWGFILFMCEYVHNASARQEEALDPLVLEFIDVYELPAVGFRNWIQVLMTGLPVLLFSELSLQPLILGF